MINAAQPEQRDDYVSATLTDEIDPYKPKEQLEKVYSHILEVRDGQREDQEEAGVCGGRNLHRRSGPGVL